MSDSLVFHLIPHTHWDREWYLPRAGFVARLVPMLDDLLARLESDPGFTTFLLDGQTVHLEDYFDARPERRPAVEALVRAGRLQVGPWYVLADEIIPSAESLIRNLLIGSAQARALGRRSDVLYSPDAFGHPAAWPSLAREFGIEFGALWRGIAHDRDLFRWRAPDGAMVTVYHLPPAGYEIGAALPAEPAPLAREWAAVRNALVSRAASRHVAVFVGADHHAAHPAIGRLRAALASIEPAHEVRVSRLDEMLAAAREDARGLATIEGELRRSYGYTWTLQGVHGTRAPLKRRNARVELGLERFAEPLAALARRAGGADRRPLLTLAWRQVVQGHFHDAIAGCAADAVIAEVEGRLTAARAISTSVAHSAIDDLIGHDRDAARARKAETNPALVLWNGAARRRGGVVVAELSWFRRDVLVGPPSGRMPAEGPGLRPFALRWTDGSTLPVQMLERRVALERVDAPRHYPDLDEVDQVRVAFRSPPIDGLGIALIEPTEPTTAAARGAVVAAGGRTLANELIRVTIDANGTLTLVNLANGRRYGGLLALESEPDLGDAYTFASAGKDAAGINPSRVIVREIASGPLVGILEARYAAADVSVRLRVSLHAGDGFVRCVIDLDNRASDRRLRARIPVADDGTTAATAAVAGAPFGAVTRKPVDVGTADCPAETVVSTAPAHRFVAVGGARGGLAILAPGFFEYQWNGDAFRVTLLRSIGELSRGDLATRPGHAGWATSIPDAQCHGHDRIELALAPVGSDEISDP
ncbi:MAG: glycoside hydrolase family 38 C-terminal domain-containing protein, partial [Gemmatimonadota bacterium]